MTLIVKIKASLRGKITDTCVDRASEASDALLLPRNS